MRNCGKFGIFCGGRETESTKFLRFNCNYPTGKLNYQELYQINWLSLLASMSAKWSSTFTENQNVKNRMMERVLLKFQTLIFTLIKWKRKFHLIEINFIQWAITFMIKHHYHQHHEIGYNQQKKIAITPFQWAQWGQQLQNPIVKYFTKFNTRNKMTSLNVSGHFILINICENDGKTGKLVWMLFNSIN